jgi:hypothetical protein
LHDANLLDTRAAGASFNADETLASLGLSRVNTATLGGLMPEDKYSDLHLATTRFVRAVEAVFDSDWSYTESMLGIGASTDNHFDEDEHTVGVGGTFLKPSDKNAAVDNWGHYEMLLDAYHALKSLLLVPSVSAMNARFWDSSRHGPISELAIREQHRPPESYSISPSVYAAGTHFRGSMTPGRVYVIAGHCVYTFKNDQIRLGPGEFCDLVRGDFQFQSSDDGPCSLVTVWDLSSVSEPGDSKPDR